MNYLDEKKLEVMKMVVDGEFLTFGCSPAYSRNFKSKRRADYLASLVETDVTIWRNGQWGRPYASPVKFVVTWNILKVIWYTSLKTGKS
ncbi:MAG: hypothetical protein PUD17_09800 [Treponema sp.]|uniref:hypothetical protein n=1 Tax=Treponema sp. TaxID=166 RepID=UPI00298E027D|nr:hypothetical protein [Treponema sp.]MDD5812376.1 hypothetical protein [Treponema sp.]